MPKPNSEDGLSDKERMFCNFYVIDFNASEAARKAGYSESSAGVIGHENLRKPKIRSFIDGLITEKVLSAEETVKLTSDIAKSSANDYLKVVVKERRIKVKKPLAEKIKELKLTIKKEKIVAKRLNWETNEDKMKSHVSYVLSLDEQIVRYEVELQLNPDAYIIEHSDPFLEEDVELDLVAMAKDKEHGRIKSFGYTESGRPKVEMYAADVALTNMLKIHGKFEKDNRQKVEQFTPDEKAAKLRELEEKILASRKFNG